jgi:nucleoside-diphosphate-sugar epimerase
MTEVEKDLRIVIPGASGLIGQNLIIRLEKAGYRNLLALDKHPTNTALLRELHPNLEIIEADLSCPGPWQECFAAAEIVVMLQAHIGSTRPERFVHDNVDSARNVLDAMREHGVPRVVALSSSVVCSQANDDYTNTKREQEQLVVDSGLDYCILRPTLMFGWFDRKHLGWLSRFMRRVPIFPLPGTGRFSRQPVYAGDVCGIIEACIAGGHSGRIYNISGREKIEYVDMVKAIRNAQGLRTKVVPIPYQVFRLLLKTYALFDRDPPFTAEQLEALVAGDEFELIPWWEIFEVSSTPFSEAIQETFAHPIFSQYELDF